MIPSFEIIDPIASSLFKCQPLILSQQADLDKKKLEDRGRVEKDKKKYAKLVEDCKQKTEKQKMVLAEVVKAQKELILANSEVGGASFTPIEIFASR